MDEIFWMSATGLAGAVKRKEISPVEVVNIFLARIEETDPKIKAIITLAADQALAEAKKISLTGPQRPSGPLCGVPALIKDNVFTCGIRTTFGSLLYENFIPGEDSIIVERLKAAGAIVIGKTNLSEFALVPVTDNLIKGRTFNPWHLRKTSGGSSGGSAAGVAAGMAPIATGNDAGGSIRIPAGLCGVYGFKPSFGRIPCYPRFGAPGLESFIHEGPITRTVEDAALMLDAMSGLDERDLYSLPLKAGFSNLLRKDVKGIKIAFSSDLGYVTVDPGVKEIVLEAVAVFSEMGASVEEVDLRLPNLGKELNVLFVTGTAAAFAKNLEEWRQKAHPFSIPVINMANKYSGQDILRALSRRGEIWAILRPLFEKYDLLLTPTSPVAAFDVFEKSIVGPAHINGQPVKQMSWLGLTLPFNFTGQPAASVPCGYTKEGLPVGLQIIGKRFEDQTVLNASAAFEEVRPWRQKKPVLL